eukprot:CAMPEP_0172369832 /NCGR_PEP_ID=MMETSP1060-20121228/34891_1 /TAXON_ID=37318 /ORGANISM="Pseudo-nitzschia pungens, Strain cf. cingulata" /LENGTH=60 /DNA_ID=CAMNT_0013094909 /DNA_START=17 /DNA_END=196 /DNA_ORIENTATION=-
MSEMSRRCFGDRCWLGMAPATDEARRCVVMVWDFGGLLAESGCALAMSAVPDRFRGNTGG